MTAIWKSTIWKNGKSFNHNINTGDIYHCDIPFTIEHEMALLKEAGFKSVKQVLGIKNNIMLLAVKQENK